MADKEERILIARSTDYTITDTDEGALFDGKIAPHCANVMTRKEAINRMAKAICASNMAPDCLWECETCDRWKERDKEAAEAALNSLLEGKGKQVGFGKCMLI